MLQCELHRSKPAHRDARYRAILPTTRCRKARPHIRDQVYHDVVFVAILRVFARIRVVRLVAFGHDKNQVVLGKSRYVRIVRPISEPAIAPVKQVDHRESAAILNAGRHHDAIRHLSMESRTSERYISQRDLWSDPRMIGNR
jgi:hypothetical protein